MTTEELIKYIEDHVDSFDSDFNCIDFAYESLEIFKEIVIQLNK